MTTQDPATDGTTADPTPSRDDDEARDEIATPGDFLKGEWRALWPVWTLAVVMVTVLILASFGQF